MTKLFNCSIPRVVISALRGGSGKTILSLCLIALWRKKGLKITPFKKGPDYIDAGWLAKAAGAPCYNLDLFMMSPEQAIQSFISHSHKTQIAVIEGNRGLYDGVDHKGTYSTAQLAKRLKAPVIIVIDCTKATNTIAAMVLGCKKMDSKVLIGGVVLNQIATSRQESLIRKAINENCKLPVLGAIPRLKKDPFPERHMGLTPFQEHPTIEKSIAAVKEIGTKYIDLEGVWKIANEAAPLKLETRHRGQGIRKQTLTLKTDTRDNSSPVTTRLSSPKSRHPSLKIGVIRDSAFQFYYPENFEELEKRGAKLIEVSPLRESKLPDIDALYIGGGFPETHAIALSENISFKESLLKAVERGLPVYAECGGLMYLGKSLILKNKSYPMAGVLPLVFSLEKKPQAHGYTIIEVEKTNPYFSQKSVLKGHEFHYSHVVDMKENSSYMAFKVQRGKGIKDGMDGICYKNVLATYTHLHALGTTEWAEGLVKCATKFKKQKGVQKLKK